MALSKAKCGELLGIKLLIHTSEKLNNKENAKLQLKTKVYVFDSHRQINKHLACNKVPIKKIESITRQNYGLLNFDKAANNQDTTDCNFTTRENGLLLY